MILKAILITMTMLIGGQLLPPMISTAMAQTDITKALLAWVFPFAIASILTTYFLGETGVITWYLEAAAQKGKGD